ncbi:PhnD/SsuA/transferrin family substrate-binding protein [Scytonema sp. UIC 10036]|uniref:phosphate/phosphite/phosphonate ABC transporter substrate-binding protein n=1 Tax=Scytonema sp. UIC 10036 TaxID=2304196 RepID=UPI0012DAE3ED|nr:PhnD/SsuA/transferrin family substrate-binding protein [Scytonema sp. UIC 10036]MUG97058.1 PhnD/SsuA/transferrin family substrate-binding protein [Scytonema sp. UIC 10036]
MKIIIWRRFLLIPLTVLVSLVGVGCSRNKDSISAERLTVGVVSYGEQTVSLERYEQFKNYLAAQTQSIVELEPAYNELQALEQIQRQRWEIVFAPPGLAAIAMGKGLYIPLFSMEGISSRQRSLLVVRDDRPITKIADLANKTVALESVGSAAGYYVPLYDLYGLTLAQIRFAPTPKTVLEWLNEGSVDAGAIAEKDFELYKQQFSGTKFRVLHTSRWIPPAVVLLAPTVERNRQQQIEKAMEQAPGYIISDAGYVPAAKIPSYDQFIKLVEKVRPLEAQVKQTPTVLINPEATK